MYRRLNGWARTKYDLCIKLFMQSRDWIFFIQIYALFENVSTKLDGSQLRDLNVCYGCVATKTVMYNSFY